MFEGSFWPGLDEEMHRRRIGAIAHTPNIIMQAIIDWI
jgi:hypothetical protein